jgi:C-terminal processing protease CtpA/Prc
LRGLPGTFVQRLGRLNSDFFFSGTYTADGMRIGLIRIPDYTPSNQTGALNQFLAEIMYMQANTDGLVIDDSLNPGGSVSYQNTLLTMLFHYPFRVLGFELRATSLYLASLSAGYESAKAQGAPQEILDLYQQLLDNMLEANRTPRGMTAAIPLDDVKLMRDPLKDSRGNLLAYSKPVLVLIDEFSASGGDAFAAIMQDNGRGPLFGWRTMGAGGNVTSWDAGSYSEGFITRTDSLMARATDRAETGYPVSHYVENVGVRPEIEYDYMTRDNLAQNGKPYVDAFTAALVDWIKSNR